VRGVGKAPRILKLGSSYRASQFNIPVDFPPGIETPVLIGVISLDGPLAVLTWQCRGNTVSLAGIQCWSSSQCVSQTLPRAATINTVQYAQHNTERRGGEVNTYVWYSGSLWFQSRSGNWLSWLRFSWFFSVPPGEFRNSRPENRPWWPPSTAFPIYHLLKTIYFDAV
jgi:hypothetical protein